MHTRNALDGLIEAAELMGTQALKKLDQKSRGCRSTAAWNRAAAAANSPSAKVSTAQIAVFPGCLGFKGNGHRPWRANGRAEGLLIHDAKSLERRA